MLKLVVTLGVVSFGAVAFAGPDLSGKWEIQSMGADRTLEIQQKGQKIMAHRVMWPEFDGEKYKLEHLYRGTVAGDKIKGELLVKEEELPEFEVLRDFTGTLAADGKVTIDGLPIKRLDGQKTAAPPPEPPASGQRPSEAPQLSQSTPPAAGTPPPAAKPAPPPAEDEAANMLANIMGGPASDGLFHVSNSVAIPNEAQDLTDAGDKLFKAGKHKEALAKFEKASKIDGASQAGLLHRMGRCHLAMNDYPAAKSLLKRALKLDPSNSELKKDYDVAKRKA